MPVTKRLELYMSSTLGKLNDLAAIEQKCGSARVFIKSADRVFSAAGDHYEAGDEEKAYVLYMKYFNIIQLVKKSADYKKQSKYYNELIGVKACNTAINRAEELAKSLKERYTLLDDMKHEPVRKSDISIVPIKLPEVPNNLPKDVDGTDHVDSPAQEGVRVDTSTVEDVPRGAVSVKRIYDWLFPNQVSKAEQSSSKGDRSVLLIDLRPADQFEDSHIRHQSCINIPADIIPPGKLIKYFEDKIPASSRQGWASRGDVSHVVLFDWKSTIDDLKASSSILSLKKAMYMWDTTTALKNEPLVLEGGYETWLFYYPTVTTNAKPKIVEEVTVVEKISRSPSLNFDYPDFDDFGDFTVKPSLGALQLEPRNNLNVNRPSNVLGDHQRSMPRRAVSYDETNLEKFIGSKPSVDRSLKPSSRTQSEDTPSKHEGKMVDEIAAFRLEREQQKTVLEMEKKKDAIERQIQDEIRSKALELEKKKLEDIQGQRDKEEKGLAYLMREKRKVAEDLELEKMKLKTEEQKRASLAEEKERQLEKETEEQNRKRESQSVGGEHSSPIREQPPATKPVAMRDAKPTSVAPSTSKTQSDVVTTTTEPTDGTKEFEGSEKTGPPQPKAASVPGKSMSKLKDEPAARPQGMRRSSSTPNIARLVEDEASDSPTRVDQAKVQPKVDRASKPSASDARRPSFSDFHAGRLITMQPQYGSVEGGLTGLRNLGNTCYMNSIIQSLNNTTPLVTYFLTANYKTHINRHNFLGHGGDIPEELAIVIRALWSGKYTNFSPIDFKRTIGKHSPQFSGYGQQDSQEFLLFLLDGLHEDLNMVIDRPKVAAQENDNISDYKAAELAWYNHKLVNESIIVELFQGQYKSTLTCLSCGRKSVTFDTFMYLSLPIPSSNRCTLQDCIRHFLKEEKMTGGSKWFCPRCKQRREAHKKIDLWKLPTILLIHLKRFSSDGAFGQKLNTQVKFPLSNLNMREYIKGTRVRPNYNLYAVSNHYGTMQGGHYTAYCKNPVMKRWYKFDDSDVHPMSENDVKSSAAYILFYTSIEMSPPVA